VYIIVALTSYHFFFQVACLARCSVCT